MDGKNSLATEPATPGRQERQDGKDADGDLLSTRSVLLLIVLAAVALRSIAWWRSGALFDDGPIFIYAAEAMAAGNWISVLQHPYHPLYSFFVWLLGEVLGSYETAGASLSIACGAASVALLFALLRDAFDTRTGLIGAAILAVHPRAVAFTSDVQSDSLYMALFLAGLWLMGKRLFGPDSRSARPSLGLAAAAGILIGVAYLTRPEGLGLAVVAAAVGIAMWLSGRWTWSATLRWGGAMVVGVMLPMAPYVLALRVESGDWMLSQKKSAADLAAFSERAAPPSAPHSRSFAEPRIPTPSGTPPAEAAPATQPVLEALHVTLVAALSGIRYDVLILAALGLWACRGVPGPRAWLIGGVVGIYLLVLLALALNAGYVSRRHALAPLLPVLGYAAQGVPVVGRAILRTLRRFFGFTLGQSGGAGSAASGERWAAAIGLSVVVLLSLPADLAARRLDRVAARQAAEWLRTQDGTPQGVAAGRLRIAYYAGGRFVLLPLSTKQPMISYLRGRGARYVIIDEEKVDRHPGLKEAQADGLRLIHRETVEGHSAAVFEVMPAG